MLLIGRCSEENLEREDGVCVEGSTMVGGSGCSSFSLRPKSLLGLRTAILELWFDASAEEGPAVSDDGGGCKSAVDFARSRG
jgi:hypothetical protein